MNTRKTLSALLGSALLMASATQDTAASTVVRTLTYHQITTTFGGATNTAGPGTPILSRNGNVILFAKNSVSGMNQVFKINADGTGLVMVDSYAPVFSTGSQIDISDDGSRFCVSDEGQLRIGGGQVLRLSDADIDSIRISGDGTKVFFRVGGSPKYFGTNTPFEQGIYVINYDGTNLRQLVGPTQVAPLLGVPVANVPFFTSFDIRGVDVSTNGSRIVFSMYSAVGQRLFGFNWDGTTVSGLHDFLGDVYAVYHGVISGDGTKVSYSIQPLTGGQPAQEAGVFNFDGTGRLKLVDQSQGFVEVHFGSHQLTSDGTRLLLGESGRFYNTDGSLNPDGYSFVELTSRAGSNRLTYDYPTAPTMNANGTAFAYVCIDSNNVFQLAICQINPASLGVAPSVTAPDLNPPYMLRGGNSTTKLTAMINATDPLEAASAAIFNKGDVESYGYGMNDSGTSGDTTAGDHIFTTTGLYVSTAYSLGPRSVRVQAVTQAADTRRHSTALDITPFNIVSAVPPTVTTLTATSVGPNSATLNGRVNANGTTAAVSFDYGIDRPNGIAYTTNVAGTPSTVTGSSDTNVSASITGLTPSTTYHFRVNGAAGTDISNGGDLTFTTLTAQQAWRFTYFGTTSNTGTAADTADPDGDGFSNLFEYVAGLIPTSNASHFSMGAAPVPGQPGRKAITFGPIVAGRTYVVTSKASLTDPTWLPLTSFTTVDNGTQRTVTDLSATGGKKFYRVEITLP